MRKILLLILAMTYTPTTTSARLDDNIIRQRQQELHYLRNFGAPCTTRIDRTEGTCELKVKRKPKWKRK